ncbi:MAG: hypothetical protein AB1522_04550 [Chloroflexota bacterium]
MSPDTLLLPFVWVLNGLLALVWLAVDNLALVLLIPALVWLYLLLGQRLHEAQARRMRQVLLPAGGLALAAALIAPNPAPYLVAGLAGVGGFVMRVDNYRPDESAWETIQNLILYALVGLGARVLFWVLDNQPADNLIAGVNYLAVLASFALWGMPVAQAGLLIKNLLAHAPTGADPRTVIERARERR